MEEPAYQEALHQVNSMLQGFDDLDAPSRRLDVLRTPARGVQVVEAPEHGIDLVEGLLVGGLPHRCAGLPWGAAWSALSLSLIHI